MTKIAIAGGNDNHCLEAAIGLEEHEKVDLGNVFPKYGLVLLMQETSKEELDDLSSELPTDTHRVIFRYPNGAISCDAVRSCSKADIFDAYHDSGFKVIEIASGHGSIKPKLFNDSKKK